MCKYDYIQSLSKLNRNIQKLFIQKLKLIGDDKYIKDMHEIGIRHAYQTILYKMHVLEQGSDSDE